MALVKKIGILTSGGDSPGMNAAIRAVTRTAINNGITVMGIKRGFDGLLAGDITEFNTKSVSDIIHRGGTMLLSARCPEMHEVKTQKRAADICKVLGIDTLIILGGDGSFRGGLALSKLGVNVMAVPCTIDLDLPYTDYTIGFDTAVNTAMEAINKIRDTSSSHERCSIVEVMGRNCGSIAIWCGIISGAEEVIIPERPLAREAVIKKIIENRARGRRHNLIVVAEGVGGSMKLAKEIENVTGIETRATILGYLQRGGNPSAMDRMRGSMMGNVCVEQLLAGERNRAIGVSAGAYKGIDLEEALNCTKDFKEELYAAVSTLSV